MFVELSLKVGAEQSYVFATVSTTPADLHRDKIMLFPFWSVSRIWGENNGIKVTEIILPLN